MIKRILTLCLVVFVTASCASSSGSPWDRPTYTTGQAVSAPSKLLTGAGGEQKEQAVYTPYQPAGQAATNGTDAYAAKTFKDDILAHRQYQTPPGSEFSATIGSEATAPQSVYNAPAALPPVKIALLLPMSGDNADLGQAMLQAAQLALFDMGYSAFELMPRDTRGTPQGAAQAAESAARDGAQLILGPLFAGEVRAAKPVAARYNLNMVAFSTDWTLAGGNTYIMGFMPFAQVKRVMEYAAAQGMRKIGIFAPSTDYGNAVIAAYNATAGRAGIRAEVTQFSGDESSISEAARTFTKYDSRVEALNEMKAAHPESPEFANAETYGPPPFEAVLLPVGGEQARSVANLMNYYDLGPTVVKRIGTGLWDDPDLAAEPALSGAWFAASSPDLRRGFEGRYRELYGSRPLRLATLAYDATALAAVLARKSYQERGMVMFDRADLMNPNGFAGIDGIFRFQSDGLVDRGLAVLEFRNGDIRVIDPAPTTFLSNNY